jgi:hypothetical protein
VRLGELHISLDTGKDTPAIHPMANHGTALAFSTIFRSIYKGMWYTVVTKMYNELILLPSDCVLHQEAIKVCALKNPSPQLGLNL